METIYAQALFTAMRNGVEPKKAITGLVERLKRENRMGLLPRIARAFKRVAQRESVQDRTVLSVAREHDAHAALEAAAGYGVAKKHDVRIDGSLIGGWRLERGDTLVDASYKKQLLDLFGRFTA